MAGLLGQALAGALMGGGQAVQQNAQSRIEQKRQEALAEVKHRYRMAQQDDQQQFTQGENQRTRTFQRDERMDQQDFTAGQNAQDRQLSRWQTGMQQTGANQRAAMGRNDWQLLPMQGGGYVRYNTRTGESMDAGLPEGADLGGGKLSDRQQARLDMLGDQAKSLREKQANGMPLEAAEKARLGEIETEMESIVSPGSGGGLADRLASRLEGVEPAGGRSPGQAAGQPSNGRQGGNQQGGDVKGIIQRARQQQATAQEIDAARNAAESANDEAGNIIDEIYRERTGGYSSPMMQDRFLSQNGGSAQMSEETRARAEEVADRLLQASRNEHIGDQTRGDIADRLMQLQDLGIQVNLGADQPQP